MCIRIDITIVKLVEATNIPSCVLGIRYVLFVIKKAIKKTIRKLKVT